MLRSSHVLTLILALAPAALAETEEFPVTGSDAKRGALTGTVTVAQGASGVTLTWAVTFTAGGAETLSGTGAWSGETLSVEATPTVGAAGALARLNGANPDAGGPVKIELKTDAKRTEWTATLTLRGARKAQGAGKRVGVTDRAARYRRFEGVPFIKAEADPLDIHDSDPEQGGLGNCYMIAALRALAQRRPEQLRGAVTPSGDGWTVTLKKPDGSWRQWLLGVDTESQQVDRSFPATGAGLPAYVRSSDKETAKETVDGAEVEVVKSELWPMMFERAIAQQKGGYDAIAGGNPSTVFDAIGLGTDASYWATSKSDDALRREVEAAVRAGKPVCITFPKKELPELAKEIPIYGWHAYHLETTQDGKFVLRNPWGSSHPSRPLTAAEVKQLEAYVVIGK